VTTGSHRFPVSADRLSERSSGLVTARREFRFAALLAGLLLAHAVGAAPLGVHPENPRYLVDDTGKAIYLTGSHIWYTIQAGPHDAPGWNPSMNDEDFERYLDWLQQLGHNFTRLWTNWSYIGMPPYPWRRSGGGRAIDGKPKFDMTDFNPDYFALLKRRLAQIERRGMYASVMFFGSHNLFKKDFRRVAWHPENNVNPELAGAFDGRDGHSFFTREAGALRIQRALIAKTIDELNAFDNILFEIINEPGGASRAHVEWHSSMIEYARQYEARMYPGRPHLIGMTGGHGLGHYMANSSADWIAPDSSVYREGGPAGYRDKVVIADTDHLLKPYVVNPEIDVGVWRQWVWKTFLRGNHPILMDLYDTYHPDHHALGKVDQRYDAIRTAMGYTRWFADRFGNLARMKPVGAGSSEAGNCSTNYCLIDHGREYLVYQPRSRPRIQVALPSGTYRYEVYRAHPFEEKAAGIVRSEGGVASFWRWFNGDAVLYLRRSE
jgi:hypothetical protein